MAIDSTRVGAIFDEMADLLEIQGQSGFRIRAFRRIAQALEELPESLEAMLASGALKKMPGIGKGAIARIEEIVASGTCADHQRLRSELPPGLLEMLGVSGIGPKTVKLVYDELGIDGVDALEAAARDGHLASLPRMGEKSQQRILKAIAAYRRRIGRAPIGVALPQGLELLEALRARPEVIQADLAGSARRRRETIGDLDLLVASEDVEAVMDAFVALPRVAEVLLRGETKCSVRLQSTLQVDLRVLPLESYGAALHYFTGSQMHNIAIRDRGKRMGLRINEYGVYHEPGGERLCGATEQEVFAAVGLPMIAPELRENRGEIEAAERAELPELITLDALCGDLHAHTTDSDGRADARAMAEKAKALGHQYLAITDHSLGFSSVGLDAAGLARQRATLAALEDELGLRLPCGIEVEVLADGSLELELDTLAALDWVVAGVHSAMQIDAEQMTGRIIKALESGVVDCLAHPTGRLLGERDPYAVDLDAVLAAAARLGVAVELNARPSRLDLDAAHCRQAAELGVPLVINSDAHAAEHLGRLEYGIYTARRGWVTASQVLNTRPFAEIAQRRADRLRR